MANDFHSQLSTELYKHLKEESKVYIEKIPNIWLQKFILIGSIIAFLILHQSGELKEKPELTALGLLAIPVLAIMLDIKVLEFSLHAHIISRFISEHYTEPVVLRQWERLFWSFEGETQTLFLARLRSFATVAVAALPTCGIILLTGAAIGRLGVWGGPLTLISSVVCGLYLLSVILITYLIWMRPQNKAGKGKV